MTGQPGDLSGRWITGVVIDATMVDLLKDRMLVLSTVNQVDVDAIILAPGSTITPDTYITAVAPSPPPPPPPPPPGSISFGELTRQGFGGYAGTGEAPGVTIVSGAAAGYFMTDEVGNWVPCMSNAFTWGNAWTPPGTPGTNRTVTGTSSSGHSYSFDIQRWAADAIQRVGRAQHPDNSATTTVNECFAYFGQGVGHLWVPLGTTIYCRDGTWNPTGSTSVTCKPLPASAYTDAGSGSHKITIRSRTVDATLDADGYPNRRHGSGFGGFTMRPQGAAGVSPLEFTELWFQTLGTYGIFHNVAGTQLTGLKFSGNRFSGAGTAYGPGISNCFAGTIITQNTFTQMKTCVTTAAGCANPVFTFNVAFNIRDGDVFQMATNAYGITYEDNTIFDGGPLSGVHCDALQFLGVNNGKTHPLGSIQRNRIFMWDGQFLFLAGSVAPNGYTSGTIKNNYGSVTNPYHLAALCIDGVDVEFNTFLADPRAPAGSALAQASGGAGATFNKNISNRYSISASGTVTKTPNPNVSVGFTSPPTAPNQAATLAGYIAAGFTGYIAPAVATAFSDAAFKAYFTPTSGAFNTTLQASGALNASGNPNS